jgi:hypothetical protein
MHTGLDSAAEAGRVQTVRERFSTAWHSSPTFAASGDLTNQSRLSAVSKRIAGRHPVELSVSSAWPSRPERVALAVQNERRGREPAHQAGDRHLTAAIERRAIFGVLDRLRCQRTRRSTAWPTSEACPITTLPHQRARAPQRRPVASPGGPAAAHAERSPRVARVHGRLALLP